MGAELSKEENESGVLHKEEMISENLIKNGMRKSHSDYSKIMKLFQ